MSSLPITIGILALNEEQCIAANLRQHYPLADRIVVVEGADRLYPATRVTANGLSTDRTAEIVRSFPDPDKKIIFIQHGWAGKGGTQAKCELRNRYAEHVIPGGLLAVIDADEFYIHSDFNEIVERVKTHPHEHAWIYPFTHFWRESRQFITGGYYDVTHCRFWRWQSGAHYQRNHNFPQVGRKFLYRFGRYKFERRIIPAGTGFRVASPCCYHFGFCKSAENMSDKNTYYRKRGEATTHPETTRSRAAWFEDELPEGHRIWPYGGPRLSFDPTLEAQSV